MPVNQTGKKFPSMISSTHKTEPFGHLADPTMTVTKVTSAPTTTGLTTDKSNPEEDAGSSLSAQEVELSTCSMAERSNGGVTLTPLMLLMVWKPLTDWRDLIPFILTNSCHIAKTTLIAQTTNSAHITSGRELKMVNLMPLVPLAISKMKADAQVSNTGELSMPTTGVLMELASVLTLSKIALQLSKALTLSPLESPLPS